MTKKQARDLAINFIWSCGNMTHEVMHKHAIDDRGTMSATGYEGEDYDMIEKEVEIILNRVLKMKLDDTRKARL